ncbi:hypothetical protein [Streptomyces sp. NPDC094466]|uniref:hypothetical protein n=1 Tax=Streptomyces sp. NPDC094466 TaxID=3366065 RepID=UPI0037F396FB
MTTGTAIRHYTGDQAPALRPLLLGVYTEVYADVARTDPFASSGRFAEGLDHGTARTGWTCVVGYDDDQPVGCAYGAPLPPGSRWWGDCSPTSPRFPELEASSCWALRIGGRWTCFTVRRASGSGSSNRRPADQTDRWERSPSAGRAKLTE